MSNVLILGCSFTGGSYTLSTDGIRPENLYDGRGWYHFIPQLAGHKVTVYSFGAGGYGVWAQLLCDLAKFGELDHVDHVIISETYEPRWVLIRRDATRDVTHWDDQGVSVDLWRYYPNDYMVMCYYPDILRDVLRDRYGIGARDDVTQFIMDVGDSSSIETSVEISHTYVRQLLCGMGIPITLVSWNDPVMPADGGSVVRLMDHVYDEILRPDPAQYLTWIPRDRNCWPHQTYEGNRAIGQRLGQLLGDRIRPITP